MSDTLVEVVHIGFVSRVEQVGSSVYDVAGHLGVGSVWRSSTHVRDKIQHTCCDVLEGFADLPRDYAPRPRWRERNTLGFARGVRGGALRGGERSSAVASWCRVCVSLGVGTAVGAAPMADVGT